MLYYLHFLQDPDAWTSVLRMFEYVTVRLVCGAGTAFLFSVIFGPRLIRMLRHLRVGENVRKGDAASLDELHSVKQGTPTMGGVLIIAAITISSLLWAVPTNSYVQIVIATLLFMGLIGLLDDYHKLRGKGARKGLSARVKLALQLLWASVVVMVLLRLPDSQDLVRQFMVPFLKDPLVDRMPVMITIGFVALVLLSCTNAVNLTDGLDGLAVGCSASVALTYLVMSYVAGHVVFAEYLLVPRVPGAEELAVVCACMVGACLGFLWFNCHPAQVFMGDTGSLALGGSIAMVAILIKQELVLIVVGGVFVMEALSVIIQVASFKLTGKRVFAIAPLHHHFEMKWDKETQVTTRFWILSIIFALLGLLTLKIR